LTRFHVALVRGDLMDPIAVEEHVFSIWASVGSHVAERRSPVWLEQARARLHDEFARSPRIADLAADAGVHPVHFTRTFARRFGVGPAEYRAGLRVVAACRSLAQQEPIRRIAIALGYADQGHLTRDFLQRVGVTPGAYRAIVTGTTGPTSSA
jgi:AraC family transcriptional regulator